MSDLSPRRTQTKVKHAILEKYLKTWGGIIYTGLRGVANKRKQQGKPFKLHFVYVDCFSYIGRYSGEETDAVLEKNVRPVYGSPIIGIEALDSLKQSAKTRFGIDLTVNSILLEKDRENYSELLNTLSILGYTARIKNNDQFETLKDGEIAVLNRDSITMTTKLINYTQTDYKFSFYFLDPYGPLGIPMKKFVAPIISKDRHDVLINMPYQDLHKKSGPVRKDNLSSENIAKIANYDAMFGASKWQSIVRGLTGEEDRFPPDMEINLVECYRDSLKDADSDLYVQAIPLKFPDQDRTMFWLYLTTRNADGTNAMKEIIRSAGYLEHELRYQHKKAKTNPYQGALFKFMETAPEIKTPATDSPETIAEFIYTEFSKKTVMKKDITVFLADEPYLIKEINEAVTYLKKKKLVNYQGSFSNLKNQEFVKFN